MCPNEAQQTLSRTAIHSKAHLAIHDLSALLPLRSPFALQSKDLTNIAPITIEIAIEIRASYNALIFQALMPFLPLLKRLSSARVRLL
jgi:hypothetical protein